MDATNQLKQAFALSCFQLIKWWKCISPTPRNLFHNHIPCQPLPFHSLEKLQVEKVGRKGGMNRNEKHWRCCYFSPSLELMKWQKLMSVVKQRRKKRFFWVWVCPHLLITQTHHLRDSERWEQEKYKNHSNTLHETQLKTVIPANTDSALAEKNFSLTHSTCPSTHTQHMQTNLVKPFPQQSLGCEGWRSNKVMTAASLWKCLESRAPPERCSHVLIYFFFELQLFSEPRGVGLCNC